MRGIGAGAFNSLKGTIGVTVPDGVTSIGDNAFSGCASLDHVLLPDNITDIGDDAFGADVKLYCTLSSTTADTLLDHGYTAYYADEASGLIYKRSGSELTVTGYTRNVEELSIPAQVSGLPVTAIDERAFGGMVTPKSLVIADSVTTIGAYAFYDCFRLESVKLPAGLTTVGAYAFDCSAIWICAFLICRTASPVSAKWLSAATRTISPFAARSEALQRGIGDGRLHSKLPR